MTPAEMNALARSDAGRKGGLASGKQATARRLAKWAALGIDPVLGQQIYDQGYIAGFQQQKRLSKGRGTEAAA